MRVLYGRAAGLDVHKATVVACVRLMRGNRVEKHVETFETTMAGLLRLLEWLQSHRCEIAAMEATGVYWKPVWYVLEDQLKLVLANAKDIKNLPGRKSDVLDAEWIADLVAHGLIRSSFVPPTPIQDLRDLTRTRTQLVREMSRHTQRIQKTLESANIKLSSVLSEVLGVTGRAILEAMIRGVTDVEALAELRRGKLKASEAELQEALRGRIRPHHRFLLRMHLDQVKAIEQAVDELDKKIGELLDPFRPELERVMSCPGLGAISSAVVLAEIGPDMSRFPTHQQLLSWAGLCPRSDKSAGKRRSNRIRPGNQWLKATLIQCACVAVRKKDRYHHAHYLRIRARRGHKRAIVAIAASLLTAIYYMLLRSTAYTDLGPNHFDSRNQQRTVGRLLRRLRDLGVEVEVKTAA
jgi:transposase